MRHRAQATGILATAVLAFVAAGCGSAAKVSSPPSTSAATTTTAAVTAAPTSFAAYRTCLQQHGASFLATGTKPTAAQLKKLAPALKACASKRPTGGAGRPGGGGAGGFRNDPAFQKYVTCLQKHGATFGGGGGRPGTPPTGQSSSKLTAARAACASLRPAGAGRPPGA
jgi:hypothetical protein